MLGDFIEKQKEILTRISSIPVEPDHLNVNLETQK